MARTAPKRPTKRKDTDFYEAMPGTYMGPYSMFPADAAEADEPIERAEDTAEDRKVRSKMLRQFFVLVILLLAQIVLFAVLINSTINL